MTRTVSWTFLGTLALAVVAEAAPLKLPRFPLKLDAPIRQAPVLADLDGDGALELLVEYGGRLTATSGDGKTVVGFPVELAPAANASGAVVLVGAPAAADVTGDGRPELVLALSFGDTADGALLVLSPDGTVLAPFPVTVPRGPGAGASIADVNGDGVADVVVGGRDGQLHVFSGAGSAVAGFPLALGAGITSPASFGSLLRGGRPALAVGTSDGRLHVILGDGTIAPGFPLETRYTISGAPAFGDIDNDGEHEVVVASQDFKIYAVNADGSPLRGFPVTASYRVYGGPALADLDRDGQLDVIVASGDRVFAWNSQGRALAGFPLAAGGKIAGGIRVVDGDRNGADEIYASVENELHGWRADGKRLDGFPIRLSSEATDGPVLADFVADTSVELLVGTITGEVHGYRLQRKGELPMSALSWPMAGHDAARQGHYGPNPARYRDLTLSPAVVRHGEPIRLAYKFYDLDGDAEPATLIRWQVDGKVQPELSGLRELPAGRVRKGESWVAVVQSPDDFALFKDGPGATVAKSPPLVVANTAPAAPVVEISPAAARTDDRLTLEVRTPAADADGDTIRYRLKWFRDGELVLTGDAVPPAATARGERWTVQATPFDGTAEGAPAEAVRVIANSPPAAPVVTLGPAGATVDDDLVVKVTKAPTDADGDALSLRYAVTIAGQLRAFPPDRPTVPRGAARRGERVVVEAWAVDGQAEGARARVELTVADAAPGVPRVAIVPAAPRVVDALTVSVVEPALDSDRDLLDYRVQWFRNGQKAGAPNVFSIAADELKKNDKWSVELVATDGEKSGPAARAEVVVGNTPPGRPRIAATTPAPTVDEGVQIALLEPATDPDGDALRYEYAWTVDGKPLPGPPDRTSLAPAELRKGQRIVVEAVAVDAVGARGEPGRVELVVRNTAPGPCTVALMPAAPTTESGLEATLVTPSTDRDSDPISYEYRWFRDGAAVRELDGRPSVKPGVAGRGQTWRVTARPRDGELDGPVSEARVIIADAAPTAPAVTFGTAAPTALTGLACDVASPARDPDGDAIALEYRWFRAGAPFPLGLDAARVAPALVRSGEEWRCEVRARAGRLAGPWGAASVTVGNAPPTAPVAAVLPAAPRVGEPLVCAVVGEASDPDRDALTYTYKWVGPKGSPPVPGAEVPGRLLRRGESWACEVTASDGRLSVSARSAEARVVNSPPAAPRPKITPGVPAPGTELRCELIAPAVDPDGDAPTVSYGWFRNGERQSFAESSTSVPGRLVKTGDRWRCTATARDAEGPGEPGRSLEVRVGAGVAAAK